LRKTFLFFTQCKILSAIIFPPKKLKRKFYFSNIDHQNL